MGEVRHAFSTSLVQFAKNDPKVLLLTGDHGYALFDEFRRACPTQYFNVGIAEQNMVGMAAGLSRSGFKPFVYGLSAFVPVRVLEQIKIDVCHDDLPVIFIGDGAGFVYSHLGTSHQSTEDISCTRAIPNLTIFSPSDRFEMMTCMDLAYGLGRPVYLRMGKSDLGDVHPSPLDFNVGDLVPVNTSVSSKVHFLATGSMVKKATELSKYYDDASVTSVPTLKPVNASQIAKICADNELIITFEEHSVHGGLGSIVAEVASQWAPVKICRIGINDCFSKHCGSYSYLLTEHQLDETSIRTKIENFINQYA